LGNTFSKPEISHRVGGSGTQKRKKRGQWWPEKRELPQSQSCHAVAWGEGAALSTEGKE